MKKLYYGYDLFINDTQILVDKSRDFKPEILLAVARGGLTLSHLMAQAFNIRDLYTLNSIHYDGEKKLNTFNMFNIPDLSSFKRVLIVDDIIDSGETINEVLGILRDKFPDVEFKVASLFYKSTAIIQPDFTVNEATDWIDFFWEIDVK